MKREDISIGASEAPAVLGIDDRRSPLQLYGEKLGLVDRQPQGLAAWVGSAFEKTLLWMFGETYGTPIGESTVAQGVGRWSFARAQIDGVLDPATMSDEVAMAFGVDRDADEWVVVEAKTAGLVSSRDVLDVQGDWGPDGSGVVPKKYALQTQLQTKHLDDNLTAIGAGWCRKAIVYAMIAGRGPAAFVVRRDDEYVERALTRVEEFVDKHLVPEVPPPATTESDWEAYAAAKALAQTIKVVRKADDREADLASCYEAARHESKAAEAQEKRYRALLIEAIGAHHGIEGDWGRALYTAGRLAPTLQHNAFVEELVPLLRANPDGVAAQALDLIRKHTHSTPIGRQLRVTYKGQKAEENDDG